MDVLYTYGGGINTAALLLTLFVGILALITIIAGFADNDLGALLFGTIGAGITILLAFYVHEPVRHEVTLRPGYVIDATKYEVVEQRGQIYVIEERKEARE
ncbi:hypothetical protein [uncultured Paenibacillus sp.]|uniref:hypothetical protein n=1 Tax=uncultured Paenibacillus sp. TaxID=227322 RepID=UPI0015ABE607|nr:hypothetical protein [uncultured Paenibacillus sp.]DAW22628.1 MAG TPA: hypothetical protein [Caudoviricetes sp.]